MINGCILGNFYIQGKLEKKYFLIEFTKKWQNFMKKQDYCNYYQAKVDKKTTWFVGGVFRAESNMAFVRALEDQKDVHEFFVPVDQEAYFLSFIEYLERNGYVSDIKKLPNRLMIDN